MKQINLLFALRNRVFKTACKLANIEPTKRQASKFRRGLGKASKFGSKAFSISNQEIINSTFGL